MKILLLILLLISKIQGQKLDAIDINLRNLNDVLETAQRSSQKVFVDDFTGLL